MSNRVSVFVVKKRLGSAVRKAIMLYCADKASDDGRGIFTSKVTIAAELEIARSTVVSNINDLVDEGLLKVVGDRRHKNGFTVEYDIDLDALEALPNVKEKSDELSGSRTQTILEPSLNHVCVDGRSKTDTDAAFEKFWAAHPRGRNREQCQELFEAAVRGGVDAERIAAAAERYRAENGGNGRQYLAYADNWLRDGRWEDFREAELSRPKKTSATDVATFWAEKVSSGAFIPETAISAGVAGEMLRRNLVTPDQLRASGVAV